MKAIGRGGGTPTGRGTPIGGGTPIDGGTPIGGGLDSDSVCYMEFRE